MGRSRYAICLFLHQLNDIFIKINATKDKGMNHKCQIKLLKKRKRYQLKNNMDIKSYIFYCSSEKKGESKRKGKRRDKEIKDIQ